jgi:hypothetical protein
MATNIIYPMAMYVTYQMVVNIPNGCKIFQMVVKYSKRPQNIQTLSIPRSSKIYPKRDFGFESIPSGNPSSHTKCNA